MRSLVFALGAIFAIVVQGDFPKPCNSDIYCYGEIIDTVNKARIYKDSKVFVDMPLKHKPKVVHANFKKLVEKYGRPPPKEQLEEFLASNFRPAGYEFLKWVPQDWTPNPTFLSQIKDGNLRRFASELNSFWKELGRRIIPAVKEKPEMFSMIYVDNPVIVPGGRFREFYYWDQFWILKGLLRCEMTTTVTGMLENFMEMVEQFGYARVKKRWVN